MSIVKAARHVNQHQRERVVEKLLGELKLLKGRTVGLLGLAFKPHTDDLREAPALDVAKHLLERGARVKVHDPVAMNRFKKEYSALDVTLATDALETARDADALVLVTEWPQYLELDWESLASVMRTPILLDTRHALDRGRITRAGFRYITLAG
jgi:UDPglucose 6-dehydrogenase